jgi:hypothetical protein
VEIEAFAGETIEIAGALGFVSERDVAWLAVMRLEVGRRFHEQPDIAAILARAKVSPRARIEQIIADVGDAAWDEAARLA